MDSAQVIYTELTECQDCYKCLRECPVKAIQIVRGHARVLEDRCIHCGNCVEICPQKAKKVRSDLERAKILIRLRQKTVLSLAPSFIAEFSGIPLQKLIAGCKKLGFSHVSETSVGADAVSESVSKTIAEQQPPLMLSSACPAVVQYVDKYLPEMSGFISTACSPMVAHARIIKQTLGPGTAVVFAGPCIAKKREADASEGAVDVALTFQELRQWFCEEGIDPEDAAVRDEDSFFLNQAQDGILYPIEGGMVASIKHLKHSDAHCMTYSGIHQIREAVRGIVDQYLENENNPGNQKTLFLEMLACEGGCVNGPMVQQSGGTVAKRLRVLSEKEKRTERGRVLSEPVSVQDIAADLTMPQSIRQKPVAAVAVSEEDIKASLASIGKYSRKDELNCSGCGYDSCQAFAAAMFLGKAEKTMCLSYTRKLAQKKANALLKAMPSAAVVVDASMHIVECNKPFAELLGTDVMELYALKPSLEGADLRKLLPFWEAFEQVLMPESQDIVASDFQCNGKIVHGSVFSIEKGLLAGGLFQDITAPWIQKDRVISQARKVMSQNLRTVQKIAYLLGENAAEAEAALTSIIESFQSERSGDSYKSNKE